MTLAALLRALFVATLCGAAACADEVADDATARPAPDAAHTAVAPRRRAADEEPVSEAAPAVDAEGRTRVAFRVVDAKSRDAITGAVVTVVGREPCPEARTDATGVARLAMTLKYAGTSLEVRAPGYVPSEVRVTAETDASQPVEVALARGVTAKGRVLGSEGMPVAGARISVEYREDDDEPRRASWVHSPDHFNEWKRALQAGATSVADATTDATGEFVIDGIPVDAGRVFVVASAPGRLRTGVAWTPGGAQVEIRLRPAGAVGGIVRGPDGAPVEGADIELWLPEEDGESAREFKTVFRAYTGEDGRYRIDGVALGRRWMLRAEHAAFSRSPPVEVAVDGETTCDVQLLAAAHVEFTTFAPDGSRIENVSYALTVDDFTTSGNRSGPGPVEIDIRRPGPCRLVVFTAQYAPKPVDFTVTAGERRALEVRVDEGVTIEGTVEDEAGARVANANARARPLDAQRHSSFGLTRSARSGPDGSFRVEGLAELDHVVEASATGYEPARLEPVRAPSEGVRLVMRRFAQVAATFRAPDGATLPDRWWVTAVRVGDPANAIRGDDAVWMGKTLSRPAGSWRLTILVDGFVPVERDVELAPGQTLRLDGIELDPGVEISGRVVDEHGDAVVDAKVAAGSFADKTRRGDKTDEDGRFALEHVPRGELVVIVTADDYLNAHVKRSTSATDEFVVTLRRGGLVRGTVRDANGAPVTTGEVIFWRTDASGHHINSLNFSDDAGAFSIRLEPGEYTVGARVAGGGAAGGKATVKEGGETKVELVVGK